MKSKNRFTLILLTMVWLALASCVPYPGDASPTRVPSPTIPDKAPTPSVTIPPARATDTRAPLATPTQPRATPIAPTPTQPRNTPVANTPTRPSATPPYLPAPGDGALNRGNAFIDSAHLRVMESFPVQVMLELDGSLPTPCHQLRVQVPQPDRENQIRVGVYSVSSPGAICTQVLAPFGANVPLGSFPKGKYTVWVNGEQVGTFDAP